MKTYTPAQMQKFMEVVPPGTSLDRFQEVLGSGLVTDIFDPRAKLANRLVVRQALGLGPLPSEPGTHIVDYSQSLKDMILAGNYDWKNDDITAARFPIAGSGKVEFEDTLFDFGRDVSSEEAVSLIVEADPANPWAPGKIENLLAYGAKNPEEQRKNPIPALGSVGKVRGFRRVTCIGRNDSKRLLHLYWWGDDWSSHFRFLAVRKKVSQASVS